MTAYPRQSGAKDGHEPDRRGPDRAQQEDDERGRQSKACLDEHPAPGKDNGRICGRDQKQDTASSCDGTGKILQRQRFQDKGEEENEQEYGQRDNPA